MSGVMLDLSTFGVGGHRQVIYLVYRSLKLRRKRITKSIIERRSKRFIIPKSAFFPACKTLRKFIAQGSKVIQDGAGVMEFVRTGNESRI